MKHDLSLLLVILLLFGCAGCTTSDKENAAEIANRLQQAFAEQAESTEAPASLPSPVPQVTPEIPVPDAGTADPAPSSEAQPILCDVLFGEDFDGDRFTVLLDDVVWVNWDDVDLIAEYGLEDAWFDNDYELYNAEEAFIPMIAFKNGNTEFFMVDWEDDFLRSVPVSSDEFIAFMRGREAPMLADVTIEGEYVTAIREIYVP